MTDLDPIIIEQERLRRWQDAALLFGPVGELLVIELADFARDPVRHRLRRAAAAARYAVGVVGAPKARELAQVLATEIEVAAAS